MTLGEKQRLFARLTTALQQKMLDDGYEFTYGDAYRDPRVHGTYGHKGSYSHPKSTHKVRLAKDYNLFKDGEYLMLTQDHRPFGEWWEKQHELCRWGGRFNDGNHYSFEHEGVA